MRSLIQIRIRIKVESGDPDPHQSEKVESETLEGHFGALEGPNGKKRVVSDERIRIRFKVKSRIRIRNTGF